MTLPGRATVGRDFWIAPLTLVWLACTAWVRPLMLPDEGRYAGVAWEMVRSGDWILPTLNGLPYFHKPPLFYWIDAAFISQFGASQWAARAAPILGAWIGSMALYCFLRRWAGRRTAWLALIVLLAQPLFLAGAQFANLDMLVAGCLTVCILLFAHAALCMERNLPFHGALAGAWTAAAVALLAKGLIGIVIPALVIGIWLLARLRWRTLIALLWGPAILLFALLAVPWFVAMQLRFPEFFHYFFVVQHFDRFAAGGFNNQRPFWFFFAVLGIASLPWLPWLARLPVIKSPLAYVRDAERGAPRLLMLAWLAVVVLFFSIPQSKLVGYVLPALPPLAFLSAEGFALIPSPSPRERKWFAVGTFLACALTIGAVIWLTVFPLRSTRNVALALAAERRPGEPVVMMHEYTFDVPFYARLDAPVAVVDDWRSAEVNRRDNWRKELADAGRFDPASAESRLITPAELPALLCDSQRAWLIGSNRLVEHYPFLSTATLVASADRAVLWRVDPETPGIAKALGCPVRPDASDNP